MKRPTDQQIERTRKEWERIAHESLEVEAIGSALYAFGSELACLRLAYKFRFNGNSEPCTVGFSENLQKWFFSLNCNFED